MIRILGLSLYGTQAASHRVRLSQFQPGLAPACIELQIQSLLDNAYLQRSRRLQALRLLQPLLGAKADRLMAAAVAVTAGNTALAAHACEYWCSMT